MEEPDYDQIRRAESKAQSIGNNDRKKSVGQVNNFAFNHGAGDANKSGSVKKKPFIDQDADSQNMSFSINPKSGKNDQPLSGP